MFTPICADATTPTPKRRVGSATARSAFSAVLTRRLASALAGLVFIGGCASTAPAGSGVAAAADTVFPTPVLDAISKADLSLDSIAVWVQPLQAGKPNRLQHQQNRAMQPASTIKVLTSIVALDVLGPAHRGQVQWLSDAPQQASLLGGTHVLRGGSHSQFDSAATQRLLQQLHASGVREIAGQVLLDRSLYEPQRPDLGAAPFDAWPEAAYTFIPDALSLHHNLLPVRIASTTSTVAASVLAPWRGVGIDNRLTLRGGPCSAWDELNWQTPRATRNAQGEPVLVLAGEYPRNCVQNTRFNVLDRTEFAALALQQTWEGLGGTWRAQVKELSAPAPNNLKELAVERSRPLNQQLHEINKSSDNVMTRMLFNALADPAASGPTQARADTRVRQWLIAQGIPTDGLVLDNGSGLSRSERISPRTLGQALVQAHRGKWGDELKASLPIAGTDGSLRNRLKDGPAFERARLKTGSLRNVASVAGYVMDADNQPLALVAMVNSDTVPPAKARPVLDAIVQWAAQSRGSAGMLPK